ncbi:hypothetical protein AB6E89_12570 [Vibrio breoganii]
MVYSKDQFHLVNGLGREISGTRMELSKLTGGSYSGVCALLTGRVKSMKGWVVKGVVERRYSTPRSKLIRLRHESGRIVTGTRSELIEVIGCSQSALSALLNGNNKSAYGYTLVGC